jgi:hypothetical protein
MSTRTLTAGFVLAGMLLVLIVEERGGPQSVRRGVAAGATPTPTPLPAATGTPEITPRTYTIEPGDVGWRISLRLCGDAGRWGDFVFQDGVRATSEIYPGDVVFVPEDCSVTHASGPEGQDANNTDAAPPAEAPRPVPVSGVGSGDSSHADPGLSPVDAWTEADVMRAADELSRLVGQILTHAALPLRHPVTTTLVLSAVLAVWWMMPFATRVYDEVQWQRKRPAIAGTSPPSNAAPERRATRDALARGTSLEGRVSDNMRTQSVPRPRSDASRADSVAPNEGPPLGPQGQVGRSDAGTAAPGTPCERDGDADLAGREATLPDPTAAVARDARGGDPDVVVREASDGERAGNDADPTIVVPDGGAPLYEVDPYLGDDVFGPRRPDGGGDSL